MWPVGAGGYLRTSPAGCPVPARIARILAGLPPLTRGYRYRAMLLRWSGFDVDPTVRCVASARFYAPVLQIGHDTFVGHEVRIFGGSGAEVIIGEQVDLAPRVMLLAGTHAIGGRTRRAGAGRGTRIEVGAGTWIGAGALVVGPAAIGRGCVIGAGAVVRADVPDYTMYLSQSDQRPIADGARQHANPLADQGRRSFVSAVGRSPEGSVRNDLSA